MARLVVFPKACWHFPLEPLLYVFYRPCYITYENNGLVSCFKYKTLSNPQDDKESCLYYIERMNEDGEPLSLLQHLLLKEEDLRARKMKGVVKML